MNAEGMEAWSPDWEVAVDQGFARVVSALLSASHFYASEAKTTSHKMHVDDHRGKAVRLAQSAQEVERLRMSLRPVLVAKDS